MLAVHGDIENLAAGHRQVRRVGVDVKGGFRQRAEQPCCCVVEVLPGAREAWREAEPAPIAADKVVSVGACRVVE